jgi:hypothetical protein
MHLVRWITANNCPMNIINDQDLHVLLTAGWPTIRLPSSDTIAQDIFAAFEICQDHVMMLLKVSLFNNHTFVTNCILLGIHWPCPHHYRCLDIPKPPCFHCMDPLFLPGGGNIFISPWYIWGRGGMCLWCGDPLFVAANSTYSLTQALLWPGPFNVS